MTHETTIRILCDNLREFSERQSRAQKQQTLTVEMLCDHILSLKSETSFKFLTNIVNLNLEHTKVYIFVKYNHV